MIYDDDGWLSPEDERALDEIERLDTYSDLDPLDRGLFDDSAGARWDDDVDEDDLDDERYDDEEEDEDW
jgi:hypothetical protein